MEGNAGWTSYASSLQTDSLYVSVRLSGNHGPVSYLLRKFEEHGDISRIELLDEAVPAVDGKVDRTVLVTYFDLRAAARARKALGAACRVAPSHGHRTLRLLGNASLEFAQVDEVAKIDHTKDGDFLLEFFDVRVAARVAATAYALLGDEGGEATMKGDVAALAGDASAAPVADPHDGDQTSGGACDEAPADQTPKKELAKKMRASQLNWQDLASNRERRTALLLRGLPQTLCDEAPFKALLSANGILCLVRRVKAVPMRGKPFGCMLVQVQSVEDVPKVAKFFHGRQFGGSPPVAVSFAPAGEKKAVQGAAPEERGGHCAVGQLMSSRRQARSDGTTSTADSDHCHMELPPGLMMAPPGLVVSAPPGLEAPPGFAARAA